jgi:hypothetical protein
VSRGEVRGPGPETQKNPDPASPFPDLSDPHRLTVTSRRGAANYEIRCFYCLPRREQICCGASIALCLSSRVLARVLDEWDARWHRRGFSKAEDGDSTKAPDSVSPGYLGADRPFVRAAVVHRRRIAALAARNDEYPRIYPTNT